MAGKSAKIPQTINNSTKNIHSRSTPRIHHAAFSSTASPNSKHTIKTGGVKSFKADTVIDTTLMTDFRRGVQRSLNRSDDTGNQAVSGIMTGAVSSAKILKSAEKVEHLIAKQGVKTAQAVRTYSVQMKNGADKTLKLVKGVRNGTIKLQITKGDLQRFKKNTIHVLQKAPKYVVKTAIKTSAVQVKTATRFTGKAIVKGSVGGIKTGIDMMARSDDTGLQSIGIGAKGGKVGYKTVKTTAQISTRMTKDTVKTAQKTARTTKRAINSIKKNGVKKSAQKAVGKAGKSIAKAVGKLFQKVATKFLIPVVLVAAMVAVVINAASAPASAVSALFSGSVTVKDTGEDMLVSQFLLSAITAAQQDLINQINSIKSSNEGEYHIIRLYINGREIDITEEEMHGSMLNINQYIEIIEPVFYSILLSEYDSEPTTAEMQSLFAEIWGAITSIETKQQPTEYCNTSKHSCGNYHAKSESCLNLKTGKHNKYTCSSCCTEKKSCQGHEGEHKKSCPENCIDKHIYKCDGCEIEHKCNGYYYCQGHKVLSITLKEEGMDKLIDKYYRTPISRLESKPNKTDADKIQLEFLKDTLEFVYEYMQNMESTLTGGGTVVDLGDVELTELTSYACSFVGNRYVWGGTDPNTGADCSGFVQYVYRHFGVSLSRTTRTQVKEGADVASIDKAQPGDLVFWSSDGTDSGCYHVAMYLGGGMLVHASNSKPYPQGGIKISAVYGQIYRIKRIAQ